jgi:serine/threonine protein kinase
MSELPTADWKWIDAAAGRFERAWKKGPRPRIEDFLAGVPEPQRPPLLAELLRVERELRQGMGDEPTAEEYHRRFPEHEVVVTSVFNPCPESPIAAGRASLLTSTRARSSSASWQGSPLPAALANHPDYEIIRQLGHGGMGVVFLAHNRLLGRDEVLKVMGQHIVEQPGVLDRFLREIRAVAKLRHPNIVSAYSAFRCGESLVFAMEYVEGLDLARMVKAKGPMPTAHVCYFVHQAALGLQHAHEEGMVHRDIKPGNLMLSRNKDRAVIKLLDFGLSKASREQKVMDLQRGGSNLQGEAPGTLTGAGEMLGTPDFVAPEQIVDAQRADIRADIYSLGCTLYYLLSGRPPFQTTTHQNVLQAHQSVDARLLNLVRPEVPPELAALVAKMMAKEPGQRFQTPAEVAQALVPFFSRKVTASMAEGHRASQEAWREPSLSSKEASQPDTQVDQNLAPTPVAGRQDSISLPESTGASTIKLEQQECRPLAKSNANDYRQHSRRPLVFAIAGVVAILLGTALLVSFEKRHHRSISARQTNLVAVGPQGSQLTEGTVPAGADAGPKLPQPTKSNVQSPQSQGSTPRGASPNTNQPSGANARKQVAAQLMKPVPNNDMYWSDSLYVVRAEEAVRKIAEEVRKQATEYRAAVLELQRLEGSIKQVEAEGEALTREREALSQEESTLRTKLQDLYHQHSVAED